VRDATTAFRNDSTLLDIRGVSKSFPGVMALKDVDLRVLRGEIHILVGENGAGKSTLVRTLCGVHSPDGGSMTLDGVPYRPRHPLDAIRAGVRVVHQEFNLLRHLSVGENIFFERLPTSFPGIVDFHRLFEDTERILSRLGLAISPETPVDRLGIAQMQLVEIAKALSGRSRLLILDEPTATLTSREIGRLFDILRTLRDEGVTLMYISHRLQEVSEIGDRITVLRNGSRIATLPVCDVTVPGLVSLMVGRSVENGSSVGEPDTLGAPLLEIRDLRVTRSSPPVSFSVREGEILGIAGLVGSGRTETLRAIFGADPKVSGSILLNGDEVSVASPVDAVTAGICLLTEDRKGQGLILDMPCAANITITNLGAVSERGFLDVAKEKIEAARLVRDLEIRTPSVERCVRYLSGGTQQKVVLAKWLFRNARVLMLDEPTRGVDVGAKYELYRLLRILARERKGIVVVSSDLPELVELCHRIVVFSDGRITGSFERSGFDQEAILSKAYEAYITGV
jgi:ribose transport system ATP-binding protein